MSHVAVCIRSRMKHETTVILPKEEMKKVFTHMTPVKGMMVIIPKMYPDGYTPAVNGRLREARMIFISPNELITLEEWQELNSRKIQKWWKSVKGLPQKWRPRREALIEI